MNYISSRISCVLLCAFSFLLFFVNFFLAVGFFLTQLGVVGCLSFFMIQEEAEGYRKPEWVSTEVGKA